MVQTAGNSRNLVLTSMGTKRPRRLFVFMAVTGGDRIGVQADTTRFIATFGGDLREAELKVVRDTALGHFNFEITPNGLRLMRECLQPFIVRTGIKVRLFNVTDADADDGLGENLFEEFVVSSDAHPQVVADVTNVTAKFLINIIVSRSERYSYEYSKNLQMRQHYIVELPPGLDRAAFTRELEALIARAPYSGVIALPLSRTTSKIW